MDEWEFSEDDLPLNDEHIAGIKPRKKISDEFLHSLELHAEQTLVDPVGFQALCVLVDLDVPRMMREITNLRKDSS